MGYNEHYKKREEKMNLGKKYKQLFEGKIRSNDALLLTEYSAFKKDVAEKWLPLVQADAKLKQLGMAKVEIDDFKDLVITFKTKLPDGEYWDGKGPVPKAKQISDAIWDVIPDEEIEGGLRPGKDGKSYEVEFAKPKSSSTSSTPVEAVLKIADKMSYEAIERVIEVEDGSVDGRDREASGTLTIANQIYNWTLDTGDGMTGIYLEDEDLDPDGPLYEPILGVVNAEGYELEEDY